MRKTVHARKSGWIAALLGLSILLFAGYGLAPRGKAQNPATSPEPINVGMVALLANPEKYEGKFIRTIGFVCIEFEGDALYLHEEDYRFGLLKDSFELRLTESQRNRFKGSSLKYVLIEGRFYANGPEADDSGGAIGNITRFEVWAFDRDTPPRQ
jgi:hypothetical protein